jgi:hypothetical protein
MGKKTARRRAPGGGRKPKPAGDKKDERITIRIDAETRRALDAAKARNSRTSLSRVAENALRLALLKDKDEPPQACNTALGHCIVTLAENIQGETDKSWRTDVFTSMALRHGVEALLSHFGPGTEENPTPPEKVEERASKMPGDFGQRHRRPAGLGHLMAYAMITEIEGRRRRGEPTSSDDYDQRLNEWTVPIPLALSRSWDKIELIARGFNLKEDGGGG